MTTIAYRDGVIAADTSMSCDGATLPGRVKIARAEDGRLIGASGASGFGDLFRKWALTEEGDPPKIHEGSAGFIVGLDETVRIWDIDEGGGYEVRPPYFAMGSGQDFAFGAMHAGADAESAVRAALAHDPRTNGDVLVLRRRESGLAPGSVVWVAA